MKNNNIYKYSIGIFLLLLLASLGSCKKFLDKKSNDALVVPSTLADFQSLMDDFPILNQNMSPSLMNCSSDEYFMTQASFDSRPAVDQSTYLWEFTNTYFTGTDMDAFYNAIYTFNLVLDDIKKVDQTDANRVEWNKMKGSALFLRSYYYLQLLWGYAKIYDPETAKTDLGIIYRTSSDYNIPAVRSSVEYCYRQIIEDTKAAIKMLPIYMNPVSRPSKIAAYGLLARTYLSMRDYNNAYLYADSCLQLKSDLMDFNGDPDIIGLDNKLPFKIFNKETIFYAEMNMDYGLPNSTRGRVDTVLYESYDNTDLRKRAFFAPKEGYYYFKGAYTQTGNHFFSGLATDEMYITRAECLARLGRTDDAMADLNTLLVKRYQTGHFTPLTASSKEDALKQVLMERRKELILRGFRWMDLKRLNKEGANITLTRKMNGQIYTLLPNSPYYQLPFPDYLVKLTGVPQN